MRVMFYFDRVMHYHVATFHELERCLKDKGGDLVLVSGQKKESDTGRVALSEAVMKQHMFIPYHEWRCGTYTFRWQPTLANVVRSVHPDIVIVMGHVGNATYWHLGALRHELGFKYISWQCGYEYNPCRTKKVMTRKFLERFDFHLAYHPNAESYLRSHGVPASRMTVIYNTLDEQRITLLPRDRAREAVAAELGLPVDRPIVLYVGAILPEKRLDVLLDAVRKLGREAASVVIVGDGPVLPDLKSASAELVYVKYPGRVVDGVGRFFDAADVFVLPGTGGLAINEAMAHGLPVVTHYADGSAEALITNGLNGWILKEGDADEIAIRLKSLLSDPDLRSRMGAISRQLITTKYSFQAMIDRVMAGLHTAIASPPFHAPP